MRDRPTINGPGDYDLACQLLRKPDRNRAVAFAPRPAANDLSCRVRHGMLAALPYPDWMLMPRTLPFSRLTLIALVAALLIIFGSRVVRLPTLNMNNDEVWSVWQTLGSPSETVQWTPYDWPPAYYLMLWGWRALTGIDPLVLRVNSVFQMMLTAALIFAIGRKLFSAQAGLLALLAVSGFGYSLYMSTMLRAYQLNLLLWLFALWIALYYFKKPRAWQAILIAATLALSFYVHLAGVYGALALGVFTLILFGRIRLWIVPALIYAALCLPETLGKVNLIAAKKDAVYKFMPSVSLQENIGGMYGQFAGNQIVLWGALLLVATALIVERRRLLRPEIALLPLMAAPLLIRPITEFIDAYNPRHLAWIMAAFALWIGWGLSKLPRTAALCFGVVMALCSFDVLTLAGVYETTLRAPLVTTFNTLREVAREGDALLLDPKCEGCAHVDPEEWDYYIRANFPRGLPLITKSDIPAFRGYRKIWYVSAEGKRDAQTLAMLVEGRAPGLIFGENSLQFQLFTVPPDSAGVAFENGMRFHGAEILNPGGTPLAFHQGEIVRVRLYWAVAQPVPLDYSIGVYQLTPGEPGFKAQVDGPPATLIGPKATSQWERGHIYVEERELRLSTPLRVGPQDLYLAVYFWQDGIRIKAPGLTDDGLLKIGTVYVKSWAFAP